MIDTTELDALVAKTESSVVITPDKLFAKEWNIVIGVLKQVARKVNELEPTPSALKITCSTPIDRTSGYVLSPDGEFVAVTTTSANNFVIQSYDIEGNGVVYATGRGGIGSTTTFALAVAYDADGNVLQSWGSDGELTNFTNEPLTLPQGTKKVDVCGNIKAFLSLEPITFDGEFAYNLNNVGEKVSGNNNNKLYTIDWTKGGKVKVSGRCGGTNNYAICSALDADGNILQYWNPGSSTVGNIVNYEITLPENTASIMVWGQGVIALTE